jgi:hypothetical protein
VRIAPVLLGWIHYQPRVAAGVRKLRYHSRPGEHTARKRRPSARIAPSLEQLVGSVPDVLTYLSVVFCIAWFLILIARFVTLDA